MTAPFFTARARLFEGMPTFKNRHEFEEARRARRHSVEHDFGVGWRLGFGSTWRISWIRSTGEVYCAELAPGTQVVVIAVFDQAVEVAKALGDWPEICGAGGSLEWAVHKLRGSPDAA